MVLYEKSMQSLQSLSDVKWSIMKHAKPDPPN